MDDITAHWTGERAQLPAVRAANEERVRRGFWSKLRRVAGRLPFAHDLVAAYYCAMDPSTPLRVRGTLFGALAYFVLPIDAIPDFMFALGFTDDAAVLMAALTLVSTYIKPAHRAAAEEALSDPESRSPA